MTIEAFTEAPPTTLAPRSHPRLGGPTGSSTWCGPPEQPIPSPRTPPTGRRWFLQGHHIQHWTKLGSTTVENLVLLCPFHHRLHHEGRYTVSVNALGQLEFRTPDRSLIAREPRRADGPDLTTRHAELDLDITDRTSQPMWWSGDRPDLEMAVDAAVGLRRLIS